MKFTPTKRGGGGKSFSHAEGGGGSKRFNRKLEVLAIVMGGGAKSFHPFEREVQKVLPPPPSP